MKVLVVGTGYVGLVTGACLSDVGVEVCCIDINAAKVENLRKGILPIYEPGLDEVVKRNVEKGRLYFSTSIADNIQDVKAIFIAVGTPPGEDGSADMQYVLAVAREIGTVLENYAVVITKSTVPVGSSEKVRAAIYASMDKRGNVTPFDVASNPEFLKEGAAIKDFMSPDRIVIGVDTEKAKLVMETLYRPFLLNGYRVISMDIASAEMTKYAANAMLATRISFMNDIALLCEATGADINEVRAGIGADPRIGKKFLYAGVGYGGSCFPKDVQALINIGKQNGQALRVLEAVEAVNTDQKFVLVNKVLSYFNGEVKDKKIAIWGLSFKPNTDDMREAPSLIIIKELLKRGAVIYAHDPVAMAEAKKTIGDTVVWCNDIYETAQGADAVLLVTEWNEYRIPNWEKLKSLMKEALVFDGRNIYDGAQLQQLGIVHEGIGLKPVLKI